MSATARDIDRLARSLACRDRHEARERLTDFLTALRDQGYLCKFNLLEIRSSDPDQCPFKVVFTEKFSFRWTYVYVSVCTNPDVVDILQVMES